MRSRTSHIQTAEKKYLSQGPDPSYLVLEIDKLLPINNCDMTQNVII